MLSLVARAQRRLFTTSATIVETLTQRDLTSISKRLRPLVAATAADNAKLCQQRIVTNLNATQSNRLRDTAAIARFHDTLTEIESLLVNVHTILADPTTDHELRTLACDEETILNEYHTKTSAEIITHLLHADTANSQKSSSAILELRAGAGGDEAALFVLDLKTMYTRLAVRNNWRTRTLSLSETNLGGIREVIIRISGNGVYDVLRIEAGVHRVQRVPLTETQGRVHTSTASVSVLRDDTSGKPVKINPNDIRVDVFRASGAGGQHVNKTESAVRITHILTGLVATSQEDRSQHRNRAIALESLSARLAAKQIADAIAEKTEERRAQLGSSIGERSDRIRTYNFPQKRVTDHRIVPNSRLVGMIPSVRDAIGEKSAPLDDVLHGGLELTRLMDAVRRAEDFVRLQELITRAEKMTDDVGEMVTAKA